MPTTPPAVAEPEPGADEIDEEGARRSTRVLFIVMGAVYLLSAFAAFFITRQVDDRPAGPPDGTPAWVVVLLFAVVGMVLVATGLGMRRRYRRPAYRRVMQYSIGRRRRVMKDLRRGQSLSAGDLKVASAMMELLQSQRRWALIFFALMPFVSLVNGFFQQGLLRWLHFGIVAYCLVALPLFVREQRQFKRNYAWQSRVTVDDHPGANAS
jgi:hypothetical protein